MTRQVDRSENLQGAEMTPASRFVEMKKALKLQAQQIAGDLGLSKTAVSDWENEKVPIRKANCLALQALYGISWLWLLEGEGPMWAVEGRSSSVDQLLDRPMIQGAASCGPGGEIQDPGPHALRYAIRKDFAAKILKECGSGTERDLFFLRCEGDSMRPTILPGEIVLLNTDESVRLQPRNNAIYLVRRASGDSETRVKRVRLDRQAGELILASDNRAYTPIRVPLEGVKLQEIVLGRVCWVGRYLLHTDPLGTDW